VAQLHSYYCLLGEIYRQEARSEAAVTHERAMEIDSDFKAAQNRLAALREGK
jgi:hypothetical protein